MRTAFAEALPQWEGIDFPGAWLRTVAFRTFLRLPPRGEDLLQEFPDLPGGVCPLSAVEFKETEAGVYAAIASLPARQHGGGRAAKPLPGPRPAQDTPAQPR
ncbi:hypothetical protein ACQB60_34985 [Actinomycetota bacterium Odt1-20B]